MSSLTQSPSHVSLADCEASLEEVETLRQWMRSDAVTPDEVPVLELDDATPLLSDEDRRWLVEDLHRLYADDDEPDPYDIYLRTISALEYFNGVLDPGPEAREGVAR